MNELAVNGHLVGPFDFLEDLEGIAHTEAHAHFFCEEDVHHLLLVIQITWQRKANKPRKTGHGWPGRSVRQRSEDRGQRTEFSASSLSSLCYPSLRLKPSPVQSCL